MIRLAFMLIVACVSYGLQSNGVHAQKDVQSIWTVTMTGAGGSTCGAIEIRHFKLAGNKITGDGYHPDVGDVAFSGSVGIERTIVVSKVGGTSLSLAGKFSGSSAKGNWEDTAYGCNGAWTAERTK